TPRIPTDRQDNSAASSWHRPRHNTISHWPPSASQASSLSIDTSAFIPAPLPREGPSKPKRPRIEIPQLPRKVRKGRTPFTATTPASPRRMSRHPRIGGLRESGVVSATEPHPSRPPYLRAGHLSPPNRPAHSAPTSPTSESISPHVPSHQPPINRETLKELDLEAILRNPQLRHDLLFDSGLQFRPTSSRRKRDLADNYWNAIVRELETGCTCATVDPQGRPLERICICKSVPMPIGRSIRASTPAGTFTTVRTPSRLKPLLTELLEVLISIIQPVVARSASLGLHPGLLHPQYNQNAAHVAMLRSILDADLIQQEIDHGLFDPCGVFQTIGDIVRCYCAPMRDHAVDQMVNLALSCAQGGTGTKADAVRAIRLCFEIMELMKLDVANHQLQTLRPYLVHSAGQFELKTFQESRHKGQLSLSVTREWLKTAYTELADENVRPEDTPSVTVFRTVAKPSRHAQIQVAVTRAIVGLIFDRPSSSSAPSSPSSSPSGRSVPAASAYPETLYLDHARLATLSTDAADFTALYMLMMLHRQLLHSGLSLKTEAASRVHKPEELLTLKKEVWEIGPQHFGLCFRKDADCDEKEWGKWRDDISNAVLHLTVHAGEARCRPHIPSSSASTTPSEPSTSRTRVPDPNLLNLATNWVHSNLRHDSPLSRLMRKRLRNKVEEIAIGLVFPSSKKPSPEEGSESSSTSSAAASGLEPLMPEITHLAERVVKLVGIHMNVYGALYTQPGFV
ncbi:Tcp11-domain-containing protein, partial [Cristinia sonorae]